MNLYQLKYFVDAALTGQVSEAARLNHVSQSAVSQAIKNLESTLNCPLLVHRKNRFQLTDEGKIALKHAQAVFDAVSNLKSQVEQSQGELKGELHLGSTLSLGANFLPPYLSQVKARHPGVNLKVRLGDQETVKNWVRDGIVELGVGLDDHHRDETIASTVIGRGEHYLVQSPSSKFKLRTDGVVVSRADSHEVKVLRQKLKAALGIELKIAMEIVSWDAIRSYVLAGHGFGLCPDYVVQMDIEAGRLKRVPVKGLSLPYELTVLQRKSRVLSKSAAMFFELLKQKAD
ncbi:MAG TPA: LysR family transcriptional regulator [Bdellovibrionales bacterium]|nr:LysR family transcriptional regulator [Bdellovibrionales bacterium]